LVSLGGFAMLHWGLFGLLSLALLWLVGRMAELRSVAAVGLALGLFLAALWTEPAVSDFATVIAGLALLYGGAGLLRLWRAGGGPLEAGQLAAVAVGGFAVALFHFRLPDGTRDGALALLAIVAAALPAAGAALGWRDPERAADARFATLATAAAVLAAAAIALGLPGWLLAPGVAGLAGGLLGLARRAADRRLEAPALGFLAAAVLALCTTDNGLDELLRLFGLGADGVAAQAVLRWLAVTLAAAFLAWRLSLSEVRAPVQVAATLLGYGLVAQVVPAAWLGVASGIALVGLAEWQRTLEGRQLAPALAALAGLIGLWALGPLALWSAAALRSLGGVPVLATALPAWDDALRLLVIPGALACLALVRLDPRLLPGERRGGWALVAVLAVPGAHTLFKQVFGLDSAAAFVRLGLAERTVWEALIVLAGYAAWRWSRRPRLGATIAAAAFAHQAWYTFALHDPLWAKQAVGPLPLANWLALAAAVALAALWLIARATWFRAPVGAALVATARMLVVLWGAFAGLRQLFAGSLFAGVPVKPGESIGWSVLAIALALAFLAWGIRARDRVWRIGSLALMLVAVAKVFLIDASGLEGLLRIASFLALGFSLIGLGWLYSRFLRADRATDEARPAS
ncbi:MAG: DUF2339 domain-containing protein, partial [Novosphingobium sp.]